MTPKYGYFSGSCGALTCVTGNDDGGSGNLSRVTFTATLGVTYYVVVGGYVANEGAYDLSISATPCVAPIDMAYISSTVTQNNTNQAEICDSDIEMIGIEVVTNGTGNPLTMDRFRLKTNESTAPLTDLSDIKIYYTGTSSTFATTTLFGSATPLDVGNNIFVNGSQQLSHGTNYFWVTYDLSASPTIGNIIDARCNQIKIDGNNLSPTETNPTGNRELIDCPSVIIPTACSTQTYNITENTNFYDDGGQGGLPCTDGDANNFCNCGCITTTTICAPAGQFIQVDFSVFAMFNTSSAFDWMKIYDNSTTSGNLLFNNDVGGPDNAPNGGSGSGYGDCGDDIPPTGFCSSSECLTFEFHATSVVNREGWEALVQIVDETCTILPVALSNFNLQDKIDHIELNWTTEKEENNDYFMIERSIDGANWNTIGQVYGHGNQDFQTNYQFKDLEPIDGSSYYRLVQYDFNGTRSFSEILSIERSNEVYTEIYPNPVSEKLSISGNTTDIQSWKIYSLKGESLNNRISIINYTDFQIDLNISSLKSGIYILKTNKTTQRFMVR